MSLSQTGENDKVRATHDFLIRENDVGVYTTIVFLLPKNKEKRRFAGFAGSYPLKAAKKRRKYPLSTHEKPDETVFYGVCSPSIHRKPNLQTCKPASH
jgi:hypothetical protein